MRANPSKAAAIVAAAEADEIGYLPTPKTDTMLAIESVRNVLRQANLRPSDIEAVFAPVNAHVLAEYAGITPKYIDTTAIGGCSFQVYVAHALAAISAGMFDIGIIIHGQAGYSRRNFPRRQGEEFVSRIEQPRAGTDPWSSESLYVAPYGLGGAPTNYAHAMARHMHEWGSQQEDFAQIAVTTREWAGLNPRAIMHSRETHERGGPITVDDVLNSPLVAWPLHLLDCCLVSDHGGSVIIASEEIASSFPSPPVWIAGAGESQGHQTMLEMGDFTATSAVRSAAAAYRMARMGPGDMEMAMLYDSFTYTAAVTAEMLGLTPRGEGPSLWSDGRAGPGGTFPVNTNGGGLSFNHSGMYGMMLLIEAYRQLSRTAEDGIHGLPGKQTNARSCIVNGTGGSLAATGTLILTAD